MNVDSSAAHSLFFTNLDPITPVSMCLYCIHISGKRGQPVCHSTVLANFQHSSWYLHQQSLKSLLEANTLNLHKQSVKHWTSLSLMQLLYKTCTNIKGSTREDEQQRHALSYVKVVQCNIFNSFLYANHTQTVGLPIVPDNNFIHYTVPSDKATVYNELIVVYRMRQ